MPSQLEAYKIASISKTKGRHLTAAILLGILLSIVIAVWSSLHVYYKYGANVSEQWRVSSGRWAFDKLESYLNAPLKKDIGALSFIGGGALFYIFLAAMRMRFLWWPFHPIGYAVANTFTMQYLWAPFFFGWLSKRIALSLGGIRAYRGAMPFFLGLIIGEMVGNGFWITVLGEIFGIHGFAYFEF
jgi:hypothetical protein